MRRAANCSVSGCTQPHWSRGYCSAHYQRWRKSGIAGSEAIGSGKGSRLRWLLEHVNYGGDECLRWPFSYDPTGYGAAYYEGRKVGAHRAMCILVHGQPAQNMDAAHKCGNKFCVNPKHVRWLTRSENKLENHLHGTMPVRERNPSAKLTEHSLSYAKSLINAGYTYTSVALIIGVSRSTISRAYNGETWA